MNIDKTYQGSCLCGAVTFSVESIKPITAHCHCTMCRKFHGASFATLTGVNGLKWLTGFDYLKNFEADNGTKRTFCQQCGSSLGFRLKDAPLDAIELAVATFDEDIQIEIDAHIYTNYAANWSDLEDEKTKFKEGRE